MYQLSLRRFRPSIISSLKPTHSYADGLRIHDTTASIILYVVEHKKGCNICKAASRSMRSLHVSDQLGGSEQKWWCRRSKHRIHQACYIECRVTYTHGCGKSQEDHDGLSVAKTDSLPSDRKVKVDGAGTEQYMVEHLNAETTVSY
jgi:hypothetical protein